MEELRSLRDKYELGCDSLKATSQVEKEQVKKAFEELDEKIKEALEVTQKRLDMDIGQDVFYDKEFRESETFKRLRAGS